jgi:hypothetical protein
MRRVSWKGIQRRTKSAQRQTKVVARCPIEAMTAGRAACVFTGDQRGQRSAAGGRRGVACRHAAWFRRARRRNPDTSSAFLAPRQIGAPAVAGRRRLVADGAAWPVQALMATLTQAGIGMARKRLCALRSIWRSSHAGCRYQSFDCAAGLRRLRVLRSTPLNGSASGASFQDSRKSRRRPQASEPAHQIVEWIIPGQTPGCFWARFRPPGVRSSSRFLDL